VRRALLVAVAVALLAPAHALGARWAVGAPPGQFARLAVELPGSKPLVPGRALLVVGARPDVRGASYVIRLDGAKRRVAFANTEPYSSRQWYLQQDRAWDFWPQPPALEPVRVAVIDSGIDRSHPEFTERVVAGRSFVKGPWYRDNDGHGTFVAGLLAADPFNGTGIAGLGFNVELLIGKVVLEDGSGGSVSLEAEVRAIRWAVDQGARVINLSLGGVRSPHDPRLDTFSPLERDAVAYAYSKGVVVVVAVGNGPDSPATPWNHADWPAALPHVIGVAALREDGSIPAYSNRDPLFVDISAPGDRIFSTIPQNLLDTTRVECQGSPYSDCGPPEFREAIGTSFAAPQVAAAAALLLGVDPTLEPDEVTWLLERSATDVTPATGCPRCTVGRDALSGWGRLNVRAALTNLAKRALIPRPDAYEPNDEVREQAHAFGSLPPVIEGTLDYWDDPTDVYAIRLAKGERLSAALTSTVPLGRLVLWKPSTRQVTGQRMLANRAARSATVGLAEQLSYRAVTPGTYFLQVRVAEPSHARPAYRLELSKVREPLP
jgi:subtilisin family serine protease